MHRSLPKSLAVCLLAFWTLVLVSPVAANASNSIPALHLCDHHRYFEVLKASRHGKTVVLTGHTTKHVCGSVANGYDPVKKTSTVTLRRKTEVRVFTTLYGPKLRTIKPAAFPKYLKGSLQENNYRLYGAAKKPSKIVQQFQE